MYRVIFSKKSMNDLERIELFIGQEASASIAERYVESIRKFCATLAYAPYRGEYRPYLRDGFRSIGFKRRVSISFHIIESSKKVNIARIWYAGYQGKSE